MTTFKKTVLALCAAFGAVFTTYAATWYVAPEGTGEGSGGWNDAAGDIAAIISQANSDDTILIKSGTYPIDSEIVVEGKSLTIKGGLTGADDTTIGSKSVITTNGTMKTRFFKVSSSTIDCRGVVLTGGNVGDGNAVYATDSYLTFTSCVMSNNVYTANGANGGAIYASGGSLTLNDCLVADNMQGYPTSSHNGGAIYASNVDIIIDDSTFATNRITGNYSYSHGGALYLSGGSARITKTTFEGNYILRQDGYTHYTDMLGGTIYANATHLDFVDCKFIGGFNNFRPQTTGYTKKSGLMWLEGCHASMTRCVINGAGHRVIYTVYDSKALQLSPTYQTPRVCDSGSIYLNSGTLGMTNVVISGGKGPLIEVGDSASVKLVVDRCTFTGATSTKGDGNSPDNGCAIYHNGKGTTIVSNSIFFDNETGDIHKESSTSVTVTYSIIEDGVEGIGNIADDPVLVDAKYCHLSSSAGAITNGWFEDGELIYTDTDSPAIDAGNPEADYSYEPQPHNYRMNIGAYANTSAASRSVLGEDPVVAEDLRVFAYAPVSGGSSVTISGDIGPLGKSAEVTIYMTEAANKDNDITTWTRYSVGMVQAWNKFTKVIENLSGAYCYCIKAVSENGEEEAWSSPVSEFTTALRPVLDDIREYAVMRKQATIASTLLDDGASDTRISVSWWKDGEETVSTKYVDNGFVVPNGTAFAVVLSPLDPGTLYNYSVDAVNSAGTKTIAGTFTTISAEPQEWYVALVSAGDEDGTGFANAVTIQDAIVNAGYEGDVIYLKEGVYVLKKELAVSSQHISMKGGYAGTADMAKGRETFFTRESGEKIRLFNLASSTIRFEDMIFTGGYVGHGNAVYADNSNVTFDNCIISNNYYDLGGAFGGAIYAKNGSLLIRNTLLSNNRQSHTTSDHRGGAIYANGVNVVIENSVFATNRLPSYYGGHYGGGALWLESGSAKITNTDFIGNHILRGGGDPYHNWSTMKGGTLYASGLSTLEFTDCRFLGGFSNFQDENTSISMNGGLMWLSGGSMKVAMNRCVINEVGYRYGSGGGEDYTISKSYDTGSISLNSGTLGMTNVVISGGRGPLIEIGDSKNAKLSIDRCTLTGASSANDGGVSNNGYAIYHNGAGISEVSNTIFFGNETGDIRTTADTVSTVSYSMANEKIAGIGNICGDPNFYDDKYCHLKSSAGVYTGDWFGVSGEWVTTRRKENSPAIDAGDPASDYSLEPAPRGRRINLGAYGNTDVASKTCPTGLYVIVR